MSEVLGYSERGMVNSLVYEMACSKSAEELTAAFLSWFRFPMAELKNGKLDIQNVEKVTYIVEQSFSKFGDLDLLLLVDHDGGRKKAILLEAKVKTLSRTTWSIKKEWREFVQCVDAGEGVNDKSRSNLFVQLYRKLRLHERLVDRNATLNPDAIEKSKWRLGENRVVTDAADLLADYMPDFWYAMLVPDCPENMQSFFENELSSFASDAYDLPAWDIGRWGYLSWIDLEEEVRQREVHFSRTIRNFEYNVGQIYGKCQSQNDGGPCLEPNRVYNYDGRHVWLHGKDLGTNGCRVVLLDTMDEYFPQSKHVEQWELEWIDPQPTPPPMLLPESNQSYQWEPPPGSDANPDSGKWQPKSPARVKIKGGRGVSTETCRVIHVDDLDRQISPDSFRVYTRHLRRSREGD